MHQEFKESADLTKMVVGHELWLGQAKQGGDQREVSLLFGHNMRTDGVLNPARVKPLIYRPDGSTIQPTMSSESDRYRLRFPFAGDGCYTAIVDLVPIVVSQNSEGYHIGPKFQFKDVTYSGAIISMAKRIMPLGNDQLELKDPMHGIFEIVPSEARFRKGEDAEMRVFYEGRPLAGAELRVVSEKEGKEMAQIKTDDNGWAKTPMTEDGDWMFLAKHRDPTKKVNEEFDMTNFVTTLVMEVQ